MCRYPDMGFECRIGQPLGRVKDLLQQIIQALLLGLQGYRIEHISRLFHGLIKNLIAPYHRKHAPHQMVPKGNGPFMDSFDTDVILSITVDVGQ